MAAPTIDEISLLLAIITIMLTILIELTTPSYGFSRLAIDKKKAWNIVKTTGLLFLVTLVIRIIELNI